MYHIYYWIFKYFYNTQIIRIIHCVMFYSKFTIALPYVAVSWIIVYLCSRLFLITKNIWWYDWFKTTFEENLHDGHADAADATQPYCMVKKRGMDSRDVHTHRKVIWGHGEKTVICQPARELSSETEHRQTLIWDFQFQDDEKCIPIV